MEKEKSKEQIHLEASAFANQIDFKNPDNPIKVKPGLKPDDIFKKLGFKEAQFEELNNDLQDAIRKYRNWNGHPLQGEKGDIKKANVKLFKNKEETAFYFVEDNVNKYAWSKIEKTQNGYRINVIGSRDSIIDVINSFSFYEIAHAQNAAYFPKFDKHEKQMINIPINPTKVVEETRDRVTGLA